MVSGALQRCTTSVLETIAERHWGYRSRMMAPLVAHLGALRSLCWFAWNMPRYERALTTFGEVRTHLLCLTISLINNCEYCTFAYSYALQLAYLQFNGRLFPLGERTIETLRGQSPAVIRHCLIEAAQHAGLHTDARWIDRTIELATTEDPRPTDLEDVRITHLVRMCGRLNSIAIAAGIAPDGAPTPLHKDEKLRKRYAALRAGTAT